MLNLKALLFIFPYIQNSHKKMVYDLCKDVRRYVKTHIMSTHMCENYFNSLNSFCPHCTKIYSINCKTCQNCDKKFCINCDIFKRNYDIINNKLICSQRCHCEHVKKCNELKNCDICKKKMCFECFDDHHHNKKLRFT
jgi:hypothetical protein